MTRWLMTKYFAGLVHNNRQLHLTDENYKLVMTCDDFLLVVYNSEDSAEKLFDDLPPP